MSDSDRFEKYPIGLIAVIIILLSLAVAYSKESEQDSERAKAAASNSSKSIDQFGTPRAGIPAIAEAVISNPQPDKSSEREKRDLAAQESMSVWSFWTTFAALGTMFITLCGTILIWRQVSLTREAVEDTGKATIAMQESNRIAREGMERQLRAYVNATKIVVSDFVEGETPRFIVEFFNAGSTPAKDVMVISQPFFFAGGDPLPKVRFKTKNESGSKLSLASNQPLGHECPLNAPLQRHQPIEIASGEVKVIYAGIATYKDVFGKRHFNTFKAILDFAVPLQNGFRSMTVCSTGNKAS